MDKVCGDTFPKDGEVFIIVCLLRLVLVLLSFFGTIVGVRMVVYVIASLRDLFPALYVLAVNRDATIANYCQQGLGTDVWQPIFSSAVLLLIMFFLLLFSISSMKLHSRLHLKWLLGISTLEEFSLANLIF